MTNISTILAMMSLIAAQNLWAVDNNNPSKESKMKYELQALDFPHDALEPWIDSETVHYHHDKHQAAYVDKLNIALASEPDFNCERVALCALLSDLNSVPEKIRTAVRNNGGGAWNHAFYWRGLSPDKSEPSPELMQAITESFGSLAEMQKQMNAAAVNQFGSGWAWLGVTAAGKLKVCATANQDSPIMGNTISPCGIIPIFTIDVWEHAYYLKYKNLRADYVSNIWKLVNWKRVSERYAEAVANRKVLL